MKNAIGFMGYMQSASKNPYANWSNKMRSGNIGVNISKSSQTARGVQGSSQNTPNGRDHGHKKVGNVLTYRDDLREKLRALSGNSEANNRVNRDDSASAIFKSAQTYMEQLRTQRKNQNSTSNSMKKLKYQFKDISSKIMRSKTSASARQVVGMARREVLRLKREKQNGKYDSEEIEAAITHAKSMERIAKKKVKHLEEEEMAKATGGICTDRYVDEEKKIKSEDDPNREEMELEDEELTRENDVYLEEPLTDEELSEYLELLDYFQQDMLDDTDIEAITSSMEELSAELMDEYTESMDELLEEMGFGEMSDSAAAIKGDMDPADLHMMKIKHRNKELKEIVKADADYLKVIFDNLEKMKSAGALPAISSAPAFSVGTYDAGAVSTDFSVGASIDISM